MKTLMNLALVAGLLSLTGCMVEVRTVTAQAWDPDGKGHYYVGYWEGGCFGSGFCTAGEGKVMLCKLQPDNSLSCSDQQSAIDAIKAK